MKLRVISNYGTEERTVSENATREQIIHTIDYLDWSGFHQVVLEKPNGDWLDVGGSLDPSDGLSIMYEESGNQHVVTEAPELPEELKHALLGYLAESDDWKQAYGWT